MTLYYCVALVVGLPLSPGPVMPAHASMEQAEGSVHQGEPRTSWSFCHLPPTQPSRHHGSCSSPQAFLASLPHGVMLLQLELPALCIRQRIKGPCLGPWPVRIYRLIGCLCSLPLREMDMFILSHPCGTLDSVHPSSADAPVFIPDPLPFPVCTHPGASFLRAVVPFSLLWVRFNSYLQSLLAYAAPDRLSL